MHPTNFLSRRLREVWSTVRVAIQRASNGFRAYYLTRSQPRLLSSMGRAVHEAQKAAGQNDWASIETAYDYVKRDHEIWTQAAHLAGSAGLSRYYDSGEGAAEEALPDENDVY